MSNFYLCDRCKHQCMTVGQWDCKIHHIDRRKVMVDYHGRNGIRYKDPIDVCDSFDARERKHANG